LPLLLFHLPFEFLHPPFEPLHQAAGDPVNGAFAAAIVAMVKGGIMTPEAALADEDRLPEPLARAAFGNPD
jgi:hypothetical protein